MKRQTIWVVVSCLMVLALLVTSCTKAEEQAPAPAAKETAPAVKEVAPAAPEEAAPAVAENMVKFTFTKGDGTKVDRLVEKPRYGGQFNDSLTATAYGFDEAFQGGWLMGYCYLTNEELVDFDWTKGPIGTNEYDMLGPYWTNPVWTVGNLAESWEFPDGETMIFHIRKGIRYGLDPNSEASKLVNGRELTADDVVFNIKRIFFEMTTSPTRTQALASLPTDVYATDKYTVVVKNLPGLQGYTWSYVGDNMKVVPPEVVKKYGDMNNWRNVVGTGTYFLTDFVSMSSMTMQRNPNYWGKDPLFPENQLPYVDTIRYFVIPDTSTHLAAIRTGKIDRYTALREEALPIIKAKPELLYQGFQRKTLSGIWGFRIDKPELPFDDIRVRRAMNMGVNRQEILDTYLGGVGSILNYKVGNLPGSQNVYTPLEKLPESSRELYTYNPEKARQLLAEAGYPQGFTTEVVMNSGSPIHIDISTIFAAQWAKIGITLKIDPRETGSYRAIFNAKTHKEGMVEPRNNEQFYAMRSLLTGCLHNFTMVSDPYLDESYVKLTDLYFDMPKREALMKELNLYIIDKAFYVVPPQDHQYRLWWPWVKSYHGEVSTGPQDGDTVKYVWIDQELKKSMGY